MTDTLRRTLLREMVKHSGGWIGNGGLDAHCMCGYRGRLGEHHYTHVAEAILAVPGIAVVELPEPDDGRDDWLDATVRTGLSTGCPRSVDIELDPGAVIGISVEYARDLAAALLAAADHAERDQ